MTHKFKLSEAAQKEKNDLIKILNDAKTPEKMRRQILSLFQNTYGEFTLIEDE